MVCSTLKHTLSHIQFTRADLACTTATPKEEEVLRLHQECISETYTDWMAKDLEIGGGLKRVLRGAVSGQAFAKVGVQFKIDEHAQQQPRTE